MCIIGKPSKLGREGGQGGPANNLAENKGIPTSLIYHFMLIFGFWKFSIGAKTYFFKKCPNNGLASEEKNIKSFFIVGEGGSYQSVKILKKILMKASELYLSIISANISEFNKSNKWLHWLWQYYVHFSKEMFAKMELFIWLQVSSRHCNR